MSDQLDLFTPPKARTTDPECSHIAATVTSIHNAENNRQLALKALRGAGEEGLTDFALADKTGVRQTSIGCRRKELENAGLVAKRMVIDPRTLKLVHDKRPSPSNSPAGVYVAVEFQRADAKGVAS